VPHRGDDGLAQMLTAVSFSGGAGAGAARAGPGEATLAARLAS
jgi:hypothetical protein